MEQKEIVRVIEADSVPWIEAEGLEIQMLVAEEPEIIKLTKCKVKPGLSLSVVYCYAEYIYMLKGEMIFSWEDKRIIAKPGDTVCIEPRGKHCVVRWENKGKEHAEIIVTIEPNGVQGERGFITPEKFKELARSM